MTESDDLEHLLSTAWSCWCCHRDAHHPEALLDQKMIFRSPLLSQKAPAWNEAPVQ